MSLLTVSEAFSDHLQAVESGDNAAGDAGAQRNREKRFERLGKITALFGTTMIFLTLGIVWLSLPILKYFGLSLDSFGPIVPLIMAIAFPLVILGAGLTLYPTLVKELFKRRSTRQKSLPQAEEKEKGLPPAGGAEWGTSITEHTTRNLDPVLRDEPRKTRE